MGQGDTRKWRQSKPVNLFSDFFQIYKLQQAVKEVHYQQRDLDQSLEMICTQQSELDDLLKSLETEVEAMWNQEDTLGPNSMERLKGYKISNKI